MKYLCICQWGHSRSVAMAKTLQEKYGQEAVACGVDGAESAIPVLGEWADYIFVMQPHFMDWVPEALRHKVVVTDVGYDKWSNPYHPELLALCRNLYLNFSASPRA